MNACEQHRVVNQIIAWKKQKWEMLRYVWKFFLHFQFLDLASLRLRVKKKKAAAAEHSEETSRPKEEAPAAQDWRSCHVSGSPKRVQQAAGS
jgi:sulfur relay (sulfurtransferase) DsrC/TusE family protein